MNINLRNCPRIVLLLGIIVVAFRSVAVYSIGAITPGYSAVGNFISELSAEGAPYAALLNIGSLVLLGLCLILVAIPLRNRLPGKGAGLASSYLIMAGVGFICIGLFPCPPGCVPQLNTSQLTIHTLAALVATFSTALAAVLYGVWGTNGRRSAVQSASLFLGVLGIIAFTGLWTTVTAWELGFDIGLLHIKGLLQRINVATGDLWVILLCVSAYKTSPTMQESLNPGISTGVPILVKEEAEV